MTIHHYAPENHDNVITLWRECFDYSASHNRPEDSIRRKTALDDGLFFVARENDKLAGTVMAGWDGHRGWLYSLAVSGDFRRCGIGKALVEHAVGELARRNCPKINLQVMPGNDEVVAFYEKLGFAVEERLSMGFLTS